MFSKITNKAHIPEDYLILRAFQKSVFLSMFVPIPLNLPPFSAKMTQKQGKVYIFDLLRKKDLVLTPEEWVRQHWIHYLHQHKGFPKSLMITEGGLKLNSLQKRSDLLIYHANGAKILLAEFKAPSVKITEKVFQQIANYNTIHKIPVLLVSNGLEHYYCKIDFTNQSYTFMAELPTYKECMEMV